MKLFHDLWQPLMCGWWKSDTAIKLKIMTNIAAPEPTYDMRIVPPRTPFKIRYGEHVFAMCSGTETGHVDKYNGSQDDQRHSTRLPTKTKSKPRSGSVATPDDPGFRDSDRNGGDIALGGLGGKLPLYRPQ